MRQTYYLSTYLLLLLLLLLLLSLSLSLLLLLLLLLLIWPIKTNINMNSPSKTTAETARNKYSTWLLSEVKAVRSLKRNSYVSVGGYVCTIGAAVQAVAQKKLRR